MNKLASRSMALLNVLVAVSTALQTMFTSKVGLIDSIRAHPELTVRQQTEAALRRREAILKAAAVAATHFLHGESWQASVEEVLAQLGNATRVSRVYIFKNTTGADGTLQVSYRFEWTAVGISSQLDNPELQNAPYDDAGFGRWKNVLGAGNLIHGNVSNFPTYERALLRAQNVVSIVVVPIFADGDWWGFMGFDDCRRKRNWSPAEFDALRTVANTLGAAIRRERTEAELARAYDATLAGWARALELRDIETEGHSQRVTKMTVRLAREMGISEEEIEHIRRGARLHDVGKMGISDNILLKPGPLTEEEWALMRLHPLYAVEMLASIDFLTPALDIPRSHHEKWDGSGYPDGLKGEQIPVAARIFAVVDVYDALTSDRPYRKAWSEDEALAYIREQAGAHFDPDVVKTFLTFIQK